MKSLTSVFMLLFFLTFFSSSIFAQDKGTLTTLSPALLEISIDNIEDGGYPITFTNGENSELDVSVSFVPFTQKGSEASSLEFLQNEPSTLSSFLVPSSTNFVAQPMSKTTIQLLPNEFTKTLKGDYYEALVFSSSVVDSSSKNKKNPISGSLAVLLFFRSDPKSLPKYTLTQNSPAIPNIMTTYPQNISLIIENTGNTYGIPRGEVKVVDIFGSLIARGIVNVDSVRIIPSSSKRINVKLNNASVPMPAYLGAFDITLRDDRQSQQKIAFRKTVFVIDPIFAAGFLFGSIVFISAVVFIRVKYARK